MLAGACRRVALEDKDNGDDGGEEGAQDGPGESLAQTNRLYILTMLVLDVFEEERVRYLLILKHSMVAFKAVARTRDPNCSAAGAEAADKVAHDAIEEASVVRFNNSFRLERRSASSLRKPFSPGGGNFSSSAASSSVMAEECARENRS